MQSQLESIPPNLYQQLHILLQNHNLLQLANQKKNQQLEHMTLLLHQLIENFQTQEQKILNKLHRLQEINIKYIKNYLDIKKMHFDHEQYASIPSLFQTQTTHKYIDRQKQQILLLIPDLQQKKNQLSKQLESNFTDIVIGFLTSKSIDFDRQITFLREEKKNKMKEAKGIENYKISREEMAFAEDLVKKAKLLKQSLEHVDQGNMMQVLNLRKSIEDGMVKLNPLKEFSLEESRVEQTMIKKLFQKIKEVNLQDSSIGSNILGNMALQSTEIIMAQLIKHQKETIKNSLPKQQKIKDLQKNSPSQKERQEIFLQKEKEIQKLQKELEKTQQKLEFVNEKATNDKGKSKKNINLFDKLQNKLNRDESSINSIESMRGELIKKQRQEIDQNQAVIGKLVTIIKTEVKDMSLDKYDQDTDQLLSTYFKEKGKSVRIDHSFEEKMEKLEMENRQKTLVIRQKFKVFDLTTEKQLVKAEKQQIQEEKNIIQTKMNQLVEQNQEKNIFLKNLVDDIEQKKIQKQNLQKQLEQNKTQKQLLEQIFFTQKKQMQNLEKSYESMVATNKQYNLLTISTEDLVKLSLQTLFNICLNKITAQQMIKQLIKIADIIRNNMKMKICIESQGRDKEFTEQHFSERERSQDVTSKILKFKGNQDNEQIQKKYIENAQQNQINIDSVARNQQDQISSLSQQLENQLQIKQNASLKGQQLQTEKQSSKVSQKNILFKEDSHIFNRQENNLFEGFNKNFIFELQDKIQKLKTLRKQDDTDFRQMYNKYKQAVQCLQRSEQINTDHEIKYQQFLNHLKAKGALESPEQLIEKVMFMEKIINYQENLLENQRIEFQSMMMDEVRKSEELSVSILKSLRSKQSK